MQNRDEISTTNEENEVVVTIHWRGSIYTFKMPENLSLQGQSYVFNKFMESNGITEPKIKIVSYD